MAEPGAVSAAGGERRKRRDRRNEPYAIGAPRDEPDASRDRVSSTHAKTRTRARPAAAAVFVVALALASRAAAQAVVPPMPIDGPFPVACTNVEQDLARVPAGETAEMYWRGVTIRGQERYVEALLVSPSNALRSTFTAPADVDLYDRWAGKPVAYVFLACYPTTPDNPRADYALPRGVVVPKMQRGAEAPLLPASPTRLPILLYSHGYGGSPLTASYLHALIAFASWGYVAVAPFHGDLRYSVVGPDASETQKAYIPVWSEFVAMQAIRPLSLSAGLDVLLARPEWRDRVDPQRVGAFGISQGGETLMLLGGAELNYALLTFDRKRVTLDARVRAAVGYVPYFGLDNLPAFGHDQAGAQGVALPFLALSGTNDPIAPPEVVRAALDRMAGARGHVLLAGQGHDLDPGSGADIVTWSLTFLTAWVDGDSAAKRKLAEIEHVEAGLDDHKVLYVDPSGSAPSDEVVETIEYHHAALDHYFITAFADEVAVLDAGVQVQGWKRTGYTFRTWRSGTGPGNEACRFYGTPGRGPNSHFYTISLFECRLVESNPDWTFEALAFRAVEPLANGCPAEYAAVTRLYNNGIGGEANHRYLTDSAEIAATVARGWSVEGTVFCVPR
jgi:predicted dienelactone hydrolase